MKKFILFPTLLFLCPFLLNGQKVLQIERAGKIKAEKIFIGQAFHYKLNGTEEFQFGVIEDLKVEDGIILFTDRFVKVEDIAAIRYNKRWAQGVGTSLFWFGTGWSLFAAVGTATDDDPETNYRWSDAIVSATAITSSFILSKAFKYKTIRFGKRKRLRLLEISFAPNTD